MSDYNAAALSLFGLGLCFATWVLYELILAFRNPKARK